MDIQARLWDVCGGVGGFTKPTGQGIYAKLVMVSQPISKTAWVHVGSINGSQGSSKMNREMALQVESHSAYCYLAQVFNYDWKASGGTNLTFDCPSTTFLPVIFR